MAYGLVDQCNKSIQLRRTTEAFVSHINDFSKVTIQNINSSLLFNFCDFIMWLDSNLPFEYFQ